MNWLQDLYNKHAKKETALGIKVSSPIHFLDKLEYDHYDFIRRYYEPCPWYKLKENEIEKIVDNLSDKLNKGELHKEVIPYLDYRLSIHKCQTPESFERNIKITTSPFYMYYNLINNAKTLRSEEYLIQALKSKFFVTDFHPFKTENIGDPEKNHSTEMVYRQKGYESAWYEEQDIITEVQKQKKHYNITYPLEKLAKQKLSSLGIHELSIAIRLSEKPRIEIKDALDVKYLSKKFNGNWSNSQNGPLFR